MKICIPYEINKCIFQSERKEEKLGNYASSKFTLFVIVTLPMYTVNRNV